MLLPPVIAAFIAGGWWLKGIVVLAAAASLWEYGAIAARDDRRSRVAVLVVGLATTIAAFAATDAVVAMLVVLLGLVALSASTVLGPGEIATAWSRLCTLQFGVVYVGLGLAAVVRLRDLGQPFEGAAQSGFIVVAATATWANDACAYFAGRLFGKHKMAPQVSPKKTWEGFAGGVVGTLGFLFAGRALFPGLFEALTALDVVLVGVPAAILGPVGDLAESLLKRSHDVKDSGNLIPGHGGFLDRIDAILFVAPWVLAYFAAVKPFLVARGLA